MRTLLPVLLLLGLSACEGAQRPLDAGTRFAIDSLSGVAIRNASLEMDSLCALRRTTELPRLIDSIKQVRKREIEKKIQGIPK